MGTVHKLEHARKRPIRAFLAKCDPVDEAIFWDAVYSGIPSVVYEVAVAVAYELEHSTIKVGAVVFEGYKPEALRA